MNKSLLIALAVLGGLLLGASAHNMILKARLATAQAELRTEQAAHKYTTERYAKDKDMWQASREALIASIRGLQKQVASNAQAFEYHRKETQAARLLMGKDKPRPRPATEKDKVVSDEVRWGAADMLNTW